MVIRIMSKLLILVLCSTIYGESGGHGTTTPTPTPSCNTFTELMSSLPEESILIHYQEGTTTEAQTLYSNFTERRVPSVALDVFMVNFTNDPEFWVSNIVLVSEEDVQVEFNLTTDQICTEQNTGKTSEINNGLLLDVSVSANQEYEPDISALKGNNTMACMSTIRITTRRVDKVMISDTYLITILIFGTTIYTDVSLTVKAATLIFISGSGSAISSSKQGETTVNIDEATNLLNDLSLYGRVLIKWLPLPGLAVDALRPTGSGLIMHQYMYPFIEIKLDQGQMHVLNLTIIGNVNSASILTDEGPDNGLKETHPERLDMAFDSAISTSSLKVTPGLLDTGNDNSLFNFNLEIMGCFSTHSLTTSGDAMGPVTTTVAPPDTSIQTKKPNETGSTSSHTIAGGTIVPVALPALPSHMSSQPSTTHGPGPTSEQTICEDDTGTINCPNGEILNIQYAYYGHWLTTICPNHIHPYVTTNTGCSLNVTAIVTNECSQSRMTSCNLTPTNGLFTDPCEGTSKYLKVGFSCQQATPNYLNTTEIGGNDCCEIVCDGNQTLSAKELDEKIQELIEILIVPKKNISALRRKKECAEDERQSAKVVGGVGVVILALTGAIILFMDSDHIISGYHFLHKKVIKKFD